MFVAATTDCLTDQSFQDAVSKLAHLEFTNVEISIREDGNHITTAMLQDDVNKVLEVCTTTHRLNINGYYLAIPADAPNYDELFKSCCVLAKASKVVNITVNAGLHGTPFNEEVERYKRLVAESSKHGVRVAMRSQLGHLSDDPDTVSVICKHVDGLGLGIDPSHYLTGCESPKSYDHLLPFVHNVYLRDSTKDELQVRVGQGVIEYGKLINTLRKTRYDRALCVDIEPRPDLDHDGELRKLRLLLESLLLV